MKSFIKYVFATITGIVILWGIAILVLIGIFSSISDKDKEVSIHDNSVLHLKLNHSLKDRTEGNLVDFISALQGELDRPVGLTELLDQIDHAATDPQIKGIFLDLSLVDAGYAKVAELRNALLQFRKNGKFVIAYSEFYINKTYYLASAADKVYLNPKGTFIFNGMYADVTFIKDAMEKLGIELQPIKRGKYKGAIEPFVMDSLSISNKEQISVYLNSIYDEFINGISAERALSYQAIDSIADNMLVKNPDEALAKGLVDELLYRDEVLERINENMDLDKDKKVSLVNPGNYAHTITRSGHSDGQIAVVYADGQIVNGKGDRDEIGAETFAEALRDIRLDDNIKAVVLRINSGGGSALASEIIWREAELLRKTKPLIVSMGDVAASGGYYIACMADTILALPNSITGSIGVFGLFPNLDKLFDNLGVHIQFVSTGKHSDFGRMDRPLTQSEFAIIDTLVGDVYRSFIERVAQGRSLEPAEVDRIGQGRVWTGTMAKEVGLVDELGGFQDALKIAAAKAHLDSYRLVSYPKHENKLEEILSLVNAEQTKQEFLKAELGQSYRYYELIKIATENEGVQAIMPFTVNIP